MPRFFKLLRSQKRGSSSSSSSPVGKKKKEGIFRSIASSRKSPRNAPVIEAAITYSLSEDEESCNLILSPNTDIENRFSEKELKAEESGINKDEVAIGPMETNENARIPEIEPTKNTSESCPTVNENDQTITFTHLELMRNELARMMQIANKDKEICELKERTEEMVVEHAKILASKDAEISSIDNALKEVEGNLLLVQERLASEEMEHSKTIKVLMQTQYDYHELNGKSWFQPLLCFMN